MPRPLGHIRILFSSRVLFDLEEADQIFRDKGADEYTDYLRARGKYKDAYDANVDGRRLKPGPLLGFAQAALRLNAASGESLVEVALTCKDDVSSALPIFRNLDLNGLGDVEYRIAKAGKDLELADLKAFGADLLLTRNEKDAQLAIDNGIAAASIKTPQDRAGYDRAESRPIRLFVDGDAVAFGSSSEVRYRTEGLEVYREMEEKDFNKSIEPGPFTEVLAKISQLNQRFAKGEQPFEIALLTARGGNAGARALKIAEDHGVFYNGGTYFMGGAAKHEVLKAHKPDLYLDDQMVHLEKSGQFCPTGLVAYKTGSAMFDFNAAQKAKDAAAVVSPKVAEAKDNAADVGAPASEMAAAKPGRRGPGKSPRVTHG